MAQMVRLLSVGVLRYQHHRRRIVSLRDCPRCLAARESGRDRTAAPYTYRHRHGIGITRHSECHLYLWPVATFAPHCRRKRMSGHRLRSLAARFVWLQRRHGEHRAIQIERRLAAVRKSVADKFPLQNDIDLIIFLIWTKSLDNHRKREKKEKIETCLNL